jgi:hypothetical protein
MIAVTPEPDQLGVLRGEAGDRNGLERGELVDDVVLGGP